jgi:hypothetical protein
VAATDEEWSPKSREDWTGLFSDAFETAQDRLRSKREEEEAKKAADDAASSTDATGKGGNGDAPKRKSFAERLLG